LTDVVNAVDRPDVAFRINITFVIANLVLNISLIWAFGWWGAAIATTLSAGIAGIFGYQAVKRLVGPVPLPLGEFIRQVVASLAMAGVVEFLDLIVPTDHYMTVGVVLIGAVIYLVLILLLSGRTRQKILPLLPDRISPLSVN
jgi:O-antigen/teichoic acid export membrane protein